MDIFQDVARHKRSLGEGLERARSELASRHERARRELGTAGGADGSGDLVLRVPGDSIEGTGFVDGGGGGGGLEEVSGQALSFPPIGRGPQTSPVPDRSPPDAQPLAIAAAAAASSASASAAASSASASAAEAAEAAGAAAGMAGGRAVEWEWGVEGTRGSSPRTAYRQRKAAAQFQKLWRG